MSDETPINPGTPHGDGSRKGEPDGDFAGVSGPELSSLLDEASSLASELKNDLGEPDSLRVEAAEDELLAQSEDLAGRVESELSEMERLAQEAGEALGVSPLAMHDGEEELSSSSSEPAGSGIPDFMSEFTRPADASAAAKDADPVPADDAVPDFMSEFTRSEPAAAERGRTKAGSGMVSVSAEPDAASSLRDDLLRDLMSRPEPPPDAEDTGRATLEQGTADDEDAGDTLVRGGGGRGRLAVAAHASVSGLASVLEMIDRPFHRVGDRIRWVAGLIGLATLATTIVLLLAHFLGNGPF